MASLPDLEPRPFSVAEYHRMIDAGILHEDERVELLEGLIVAVSPRCVEVLRDPDPQQGGYRDRSVLRRDEEARSSSVPELVVRLSDLLD
jgi:hypothetical protein